MISTDYAKTLSFPGVSADPWPDPTDDLESVVAWGASTVIKSCAMNITQQQNGSGIGDHAVSLGGGATGARITQLGSLQRTSFQAHFSISALQSMTAPITGWIFKWNGATNSTRALYFLETRFYGTGGTPPNKTGVLIVTLWKLDSTTWTSLGSTSGSDFIDGSSGQSRPFEMWLTCEQRATTCRIAANIHGPPQAGTPATFGTTAGPIEVIDSTTGIWDTDGYMGLGSCNATGAASGGAATMRYTALEIHDGPKNSPTLATRNQSLALASLQRGWS